MALLGLGSQDNIGMRLFTTAFAHIQVGVDARLPFAFTGSLDVLISGTSS